MVVLGGEFCGIGGLKVFCGIGLEIGDGGIDMMVCIGLLCGFTVVGCSCDGKWVRGICREL